MTYDERREIEELMKIVKKNCERTLRSIDILKDSIEKMPCEICAVKDKNSGESAKENFLINY